MAGSVIKYGTMPDGQVVHAVTIGTGSVSAKIITYGATIADLHAPDSSGVVGDVLLGFTNLAGWTGPGNHCFNCIIGRTAGRNDAKGIDVDGTHYDLPGNDGGNPETDSIKSGTNLHGGMELNTVVWTVAKSSAEAVTLEYCSPDLTNPGKYPGEVRGSV
jgi:aldose 1-epimerase